MDNTKNLLLVIIVFALIGGVYLIYQKAMPTYNTYKEVQSKTVELEDLKTQIHNLKVKKEAYEKAERVKTKPIYKSDLESKDQLSSFGVMFEDVIQSAKYNGLKLRSIAYKLMPQGDVIANSLGDSYNACAIDMQLIGTYSQLNSYFQDIFNYPYLINLDKMSITPYIGDKKVLIADVTVIIYSEKNELQKEAAKAAKALSNTK